MEGVCARHAEGGLGAVDQEPLLLRVKLRAQRLPVRGGGQGGAGRRPHLALVALQPAHTNQTCNNGLLLVGILQGKGQVNNKRVWLGLLIVIKLYHLLIVSGGELTDGTADEEKQNVGHGEERGEQGSSYLRHTHVIFIMDT